MKLAVIPARGGSKRLPGKNIADLGGRALIMWTLETAIKSAIFDKIVVTTDDPKIAAVVGVAAAVHIRDPNLARDDTPMLPVIVDVYEQYRADVVVTLQPTSPFRTTEDIRLATQQLIDTKADSVFSVTEAPDDLVFEVGHAKRLRKLPNIVLPNGALFIITADALERGESWFSGVAYGYPMPKDRSLDIDTPLDLEIARMIVGRREHSIRNTPRRAVRAATAQARPSP